MRKKNFNKLSKKKKIVLFAVIKKKVNVYYRLLISIFMYDISRTKTIVEIWNQTLATPYSTMFVLFAP